MSDSPKRKAKSRWLTFNLRALFFLVTIICICGGSFIVQVHRQKSVREWATENGADAIYGYQIDATGNYDPNAIPSAPGFISRRFEPDYFSTLFSLVFVDCPISDISPIKRFPDLKGLWLMSTEVEDLSALSHMNQLDSLLLDGSPVKDLTPIAALPNLESLSVRGTKVKDISPLVNLHSLKLLIVSDLNLSERQLDEIRAAHPECVVQQ